MDVAHALEAQRRERAFDRLALRIEDSRFGPDEDPRPHRVRFNQSSKGSPVIRSYASTYFSRVRATTSSGIGGAGGLRSQPVEEAQSRTNCLSKLGCPRPGSYSSAGQKREESGVHTSSPRVSSPSASRPNSN